MASTLPPEVEASYSAIIDAILASSDLETVSAKRIRKGLQEQVDYDITPQKQAITDLIMTRFDKIQRDRESSATNPTAAGVVPVGEPAPTTNGAPHHHHNRTKKEGDASEPTSPTKRKAASSSDEDMSDIADSPPPKKVKKTSTTTTSKPRPRDAEETDEQLAKRMQAELNAPSARSTRGGGGGGRKKGVAKKGGKKDATPKKSRTKAKSKSKIRSEDDSEVDDSSSEGGREAKPERVRTGGFHKPYTLSPALSSLLGGQTTLSRPQTVKQIWAYVKERELQDPSDKRQIRCDDAMRAVFRQERVHMFTMNKLLAGHLYAADE